MERQTQDDGMTALLEECRRLGVSLGTIHDTIQRGFHSLDAHMTNLDATLGALERQTERTSVALLGFGDRHKDGRREGVDSRSFGLGGDKTPSGPGRRFVSWYG